VEIPRSKEAGEMRTIYINGKKVKITAETFRRIGKIAEERKINLSEAISFCLQKVI
jgi:predicted site-specific integrase-resolvase